MKDTSTCTKEQDQNLIDPFEYLNKAEISDNLKEMLEAKRAPLMTFKGGSPTGARSK